MSSLSDVRLDRLLQLARKTWVFVAKGPVYHYTYGRWRLDGWWRNRMNCFADMDDPAFFERLALDVQALAGVSEAAAEGDYDLARFELAAYLCARDWPQFHFGWKDRARVLSAIKDEQRESTTHAADEICENVFRFRRVPAVQFEDGVDWSYCPDGNTDWTWDLNRHSYFITLGKAYWYTCDDRYAAKFVELVLDWMSNNPARVGRRNWNSVLEVAVRINSWVWAYFFFRQAKPFGQGEHIEFLKGLFTHARYLSTRIERHATNNHLLLEAKALAFCGLLFPEFREAQEWQALGLQILWDEVQKQVCADGTHAERAPLYHRRVMSDLLEMLVLFENNGLHVPEMAIDRVEKMLDFDVNILKPDGTIPLFSDSALTEVQARFTPRGGGMALFDRVQLDDTGLDEDMAWLLGRRDLEPRTTRLGSRPQLTSRAFPEGGYFVMRGGQGEEGLYMAFDCGPFGYEPTPIHGHADALSFELYAYERSLITDCGVYSYHLGEDWRYYFRGTRAHNTVVIDGKDQSILLNSGRVYRMARATLHQWVSDADFDFVDGSHDGYCRLAAPVVHRRKIFFLKPEYWIVVDLLTGRAGEHCLEQCFHLMPWAAPVVDQDTMAAHVENDGAAVMTIAPLKGSALQVEVITGAVNPIQGWVSFHSGEKVAAPVLKYRTDVRVPACFVTALYPHPPGSASGPRVTAIDVVSRDGKSAAETEITGLTLETAEYVDTCLIAHDGAPRWKVFAGYESDGDLIHVRRRKKDGAVERLLLRGGHQLSFQGQSLLGALDSSRDFEPLHHAVPGGRR